MLKVSKLKKSVLAALFMGVLTLSAPAGALAATSVTEGSGGSISVDELISQSDQGEKLIFNNSLLRSSAGGGDFWVVWGFTVHESHYQHYFKTHRSSASNLHSTKRSEWMSRGNEAVASIKSTPFGNKANWETLDY